MVYITKKIDLQTYNDLKTKGSQALKDFGFECLYNSGYIKSDREYKGCYLHKHNEQFEIVLVTENISI